MAEDLQPTPIPEHIPEGWREVLEVIDAKHIGAHRRIRDDLERTAQTLSNTASLVQSNYNYFVLQQGALQRSIDEAKVLAQRQVDGTTVVWGTKTVAGIILAVVAGVAGYLDLRNTVTAQGRAQEAQYEQVTKTLAEWQKQREADRREANDRLTQFLTQQLNTTTAVAAAAKGTKK